MWVTRIIQSLSLAQRFMLASLVVLSLSMAGLGWWVGQQIEAGVIQRTIATTSAYLESIITPHLQSLSQQSDLSPEQVETLDRLLSETSLGRQVIAFKIWGPHGRILYSPADELTGQSFAIGDDQARAWQGEIVGHISNLSRDENAVERRFAPRLLETYAPIYATGSTRVIAVAEFYQQVDDLQRELVVAQRNTWLVVGLATALMYLVLASIVQRGSDTIARQQRELKDQVASLSRLLSQNQELSERVRLAASRTTALNERYLRRISAELHDGPAQDLSYALLRLDAVAAISGPDSQTGASTDDLDKIQMSLNRAMREVRAISAGLRLPELNQLTLTDTVRRVIQLHERRTETAVTVGLNALPDHAPLPVKITVFRVIEEALNNAFRHAGGRGQRVELSTHGAILALTIADAGPGFTEAPATNGRQRLGVIGMRERVESLGGLFRIERAPGTGTLVTAHLPLQMKETNDVDDWL